jgi:hypothetical protein
MSIFDGNSAKKMEPCDWQEFHSPTEAIVIKLTGLRGVQKCKRRKSDARIWEKIEAEKLEKAAIRIVRGFDYITNPVQIKGISLEMRVSEGGKKLDDVEDWLSYLSRCADDYIAWGNRCIKLGINVSAVMDILGYGMGARAVDNLRRKRHGWAMENLIDGLKEYEINN